MKLKIDNVMIVNLRNITAIIKIVITIFRERSRDLMKSLTMSTKCFDDDNLFELSTWLSFIIFSYFLVNFMTFFIFDKSRHSSYCFLYSFHLIKYSNSRISLWRLLIIFDNSHDLILKISSFIYIKSKCVSFVR